MKNTSVFLALLILIFFQLSRADSFAESDPKKEILVYIEPSIMDFPDSTDQEFDLPYVGLSPSPLFNLLDTFNIQGFRRAFPSFTKNDSNLISESGLIIDISPFSRIYIIALTTEESVDSLIEFLNELVDYVVFAEKNFSEDISVSSDPSSQYQWYLKNNGTYGTAGADINIEPVWSIITGGSRKIAIFDMGVMLNHRDLDGRISGDSYLTQPHGTQVAGIIGAITNNSYDIKGINWSSQLISYRILNDNIPISDAEIANKIINGSNETFVMNHSWEMHGQNNFRETIRLAFQYSTLLGRINVAVMGNKEASDPPFYVFPASLNGVMAIGATNFNDVSTSYSNYYYYIDLCAPGGETGGNHSAITTLSTNNSTVEVTGTSFSTPMVSGVASLMQNYRLSDREDIEGLLKSSAIDKGDAGWDQYYGWGRIDAGKAINFMRAPYSVLNYPQTGSITGGTHQQEIPISYSVTVAGANPLQSGVYYIKVNEIRKTVNFTLPNGHSLIGAWGRSGAQNPNAITGWAIDLSQSSYLPRRYVPTPFCEIVPGTLTNNSATLRTYTFKIYRNYGYSDYVGTFPVSSPSNVTNWQYTLLTKNNRIKFWTNLDYSGTKTITFENDTLYAFDEISDFLVSDSTQVILPDSAILNLPDNYTLRFKGKTTSLRLNPHSKIIFGSNSKIVFDSSASLISNGAEFCSRDTTEKWEGVILSNSGVDSIIGCTFSNAKTAISIINNSNFSNVNRIIKGNTFNVPTGEVNRGIYGENNYRLLVQNNIFNLPVYNSIASPPEIVYVGLYLKNNSSGGAAGEPVETETSPYSLNIIGNTFNNGCASIILANYLSNVLPYNLNRNTFNHASSANLIGIQIAGSIKNNQFTSDNVPLGIHLVNSSPDLYNNSIEAKDVSLHLAANSYPNLAPIISNGDMIWSGGKNSFHTTDVDNIQLSSAVNIFTDWGNNNFNVDENGSYHIYGWMDSSVNNYYARDNCWNNGTSAAISLAKDNTNLIVPTIYLNFSYDCSSTPSTIDWIVTNKGNGIFDSTKITDDMSGVEVSQLDQFYFQADEYMNVDNYPAAIATLKNLIGLESSASYHGPAYILLYGAYGGLDTSANLQYHNDLWTDLIDYLENEIEMERSGDVDLAIEILVMCYLELEELEMAYPVYEMLALYHPDPNIRLAASWNFQELQDLIESGEGGGTSRRINVAEKELLILEETKRINKIIDDNPILKKVKASFDKKLQNKEEKIKKDIKLNKDKSVLKDLRRSIDLDNLKMERANRNIFFSENLTSEESYKRRMEDLSLTSTNVRNIVKNNPEANIIPLEYKLSQNYPNPFNPLTIIDFQIPTDGLVKIKIFDVSGREIKKLVNEFRQAGSYSEKFVGVDLASGIYFYRIEVNEFVSTRRMVLIK